MTPIILTGMHRSGTSAVARLCQTLGLSVGANLLPATENNRHGHFEETAFIQFHDALISRFFPERAPFCEWLPLVDADISHTAADRAHARELWDAHVASGGVAWKDPRTSLFLDLWLDVLPEAKVVVCVRHPYQVHLSLLRRGEPFLHADYSAGIRGWCIYNQRILRALAPVPVERFHIVPVDTAFRHPRQLTEDLSRFFGVTAPAPAAEAITADEFHFEEDLGRALEGFAEFFPQVHALHRALEHHDFSLTPPLDSPAARPIRSEEARLIEFEEIHGLRRRMRKMLIRSIAADRRRIVSFNQLSAEASAEKDRLIDDLTRFNERLKQEVLRLRGR